MDVSMAAFEGRCGRPTDRGCAEQLLAIGLRQARKLSLSPDDCEDCAHSFLAKLVLQGWQATMTRLCQPGGAAWAHCCARNHAINCRREIVRRWRREFRCISSSCLPGTAWALFTEATSVEDAVINRMNGAALHKAIGRLPVEQRRLITGFYFCGSSANELAQMTGRTPGAVSTELWRARKSLRYLLCGIGA